MPNNKINVEYCPSCNKEDKGEHYCYKCGVYLKTRERDKIRIEEVFRVTDWFSSRGGAGLVLTDSKGEEYRIYMSDIFPLIKDKELGTITLEEVKKGSAHGWKVVGQCNTILRS